MKEKFLALIEELKQTKIVETLDSCSNIEEFMRNWKEFVDNNADLVFKIKDWSYGFSSLSAEPIFEYGEELENPMEIVVALRIINDMWISEDEIFEYKTDLYNALINLKKKLAVTIANLMENDLICGISAKDIFSI